MIRRTTWILLGVFLLLLVLVWALQNPRFNLGGQVEATPSQQATAAQLFDFQPEEVSGLVIEAVSAPAANATLTANAAATFQATLTRTPTSTPTLPVTGTQTATLTLPPEDIEFTRAEYRKDSSGVWTIVEPQGSLSDVGTVESTVGQLIRTNPLDTLESAPPLDVIGLQPPLYQVTLNLEDGRQFIVRVGAKTVTGSGYYLQVDDGPIAVVNQFSVQSILDLLENPPLQPTETPTPEGGATQTPEAVETGGTEATP